MEVHLGGDRAVSKEQVVAMIDVSREISRDMRSLLRRVREAGLLFVLGRPVKSLVVCQKEDLSFYYLSPFSTKTLAGRVERDGYSIPKKHVENG